MSEVLVIEEAKDQNGKFIGHRLSVGKSKLLVFADQAKMPGFRLGDGFVPAYNGAVTYTQLNLANFRSSAGQVAPVKCENCFELEA